MSSMPHKFVPCTSWFSFSQSLKLLVILCNETLCTELLSYRDDYVISHILMNVPDNAMNKPDLSHISKFHKSTLTNLVLLCFIWDLIVLLFCFWMLFFFMLICSLQCSCLVVYMPMPILLKKMCWCSRCQMQSSEFLINLLEQVDAVVDASDFSILFFQ